MLPQSHISILTLNLSNIDTAIVHAFVNKLAFRIDKVVLFVKHVVAYLLDTLFLQMLLHILASGYV